MTALAKLVWSGCKSLIPTQVCQKGASQTCSKVIPLIEKLASSAENWGKLLAVLPPLIALGYVNKEPLQKTMNFIDWEGFEEAPWYEKLKLYNFLQEPEWEPSWRSQRTLWYQLLGPKCQLCRKRCQKDFFSHSHAKEKHIFHKHCIKTLRERSDHCPICLDVVHLSNERSGYVREYGRRIEELSKITGGIAATLFFIRVIDMLYGWGVDRTNIESVILRGMRWAAFNQNATNFVSGCFDVAGGFFEGERVILKACVQSTFEMMALGRVIQWVGRPSNLQAMKASLHKKVQQTIDKVKSLVTF